MVYAKPENEFARLVCRSTLPETGSVLDLEATEAECRAVAKRLGLVALSSLSARLEVMPWRRQGLAVSGDYCAEVVQTCVVSLDDFTSQVAEKISAHYAEADDPIMKAPARADAEIVVDPDAEDDPDVLENGCADLGELVVESLALALDPYPHKPGVRFEDIISLPNEDGSVADGGKPSPFAALKSLKLPTQTD